MSFQLARTSARNLSNGRVEITKKEKNDKRKRRGQVEWLANSTTVPFPSSRRFLRKRSGYAAATSPQGDWDLVDAASSSHDKWSPPYVRFGRRRIEPPLTRRQLAVGDDVAGTLFIRCLNLGVGPSTDLPSPISIAALRVIAGVAAVPIVSPLSLRFSQNQDLESVSARSAGSGTLLGVPPLLSKNYFVARSSSPSNIRMESGVKGSHHAASGKS